MLSMLCIMAMTMECHLVTQFLSPATMLRGEVIDFNSISILEEQSAPSALPLLFVQELGLVAAGTS
jgi:hypothetical protein